MRINCPYCRERDASEFSYLGDASLLDRPDPNANDAAERFHEYVYLRDNPAGLHRELWYHGSGCRSWLAVTRNTRTHAIERAELVRPPRASSATGEGR
jgi:methylglutamate dehydrogenase subunit B